MGFFDFLEKANNVGGMAGNGLGLASAFTEGATSGWLGLASGGLSTLGGVADFAGGVNDRAQLSKKNENGKYVDENGRELSEEEVGLRGGKKASAYMGMAGGGLGALGGIADMISGGGKAFGNKSLERWGGVASGILGALGGGLGIFKGLHDRRMANKELAIKQKQLSEAQSYQNDEKALMDLENKKKVATGTGNKKDAEEAQKAMDELLNKNQNLKEMQAMKETLMSLQQQKATAEKNNKTEEATEIQKMIDELQQKMDEKKENLNVDRIENEIGELNEKKGAAKMGILSGALSGIAGILGAFGSGFDNEATQKAGAVVGNGSGFLMSGLGLFGVDGKLGALTNRKQP